MKLIESMGKAEGSVEVIPTTENKEIQFEFMVFNSKTH